MINTTWSNANPSQVHKAWIRDKSYYWLLSKVVFSELKCPPVNDGRVLKISLNFEKMSLLRVMKTKDILWSFVFISNLNPKFTNKLKTL